ncbi:MAG: nickel pincer cofactor biosynthesis protein LarB [Nanoarchaeota archaeon]
MNIEKALDEFKNNKLTKEELKKLILKDSFTSIEAANIDTDRKNRRGFPESVYCLHKTPSEVKKIFLEMSKNNDVIIGTKAKKEHFEKVKELRGIEYDETSGVLIYKSKNIKKKGNIVIVTGGTSDKPIAEETAITAECMECNVTRRYDYGIAGINRLLSIREELEKANVVIAIAGMEGALPSVVSGLISKPLIAVPTSVGYGANMQGVTALLAMLNSCSPGLAVVNIDNGFGAGYMAALINKQSEKK